MLATRVAATGTQASILFTFYGLNIIHKDFARLLKVSSLGNPAVPMPLPMPNVVLGLPGVGATAMPIMKSKDRSKKVAGGRELIDSARGLEVRLIACQMTLDVFGYSQGDFVEDVELPGGIVPPRRLRTGIRPWAREAHSEITVSRLQTAASLAAETRNVPLGSVV